MRFPFFHCVSDEAGHKPNNPPDWVVILIYGIKHILKPA
jgi:hypothetical protein